MEMVSEFALEEKKPKKQKSLLNAINIPAKAVVNPVEKKKETEDRPIIGK